MQFKVLRSASTVVDGWRLKVLTSTSKTAGETNFGSVGPSMMFFTPKWRRASRTNTAFCSYHAMLYEIGRSFTPHLNASARAKAMATRL